MSRKNIFLLLLAIIPISLVGFFLIRGNDKTEQIVYEDTLSISKEYLALRYKTDNVLVNAKDYESYDDWNTEVESIIQEWEDLEAKVLNLEENASKLAEETISSNIVNKAYAYDTKEVQAVIESAPAGRTVRTLAQHFGVDVKKAQLILNQSQDMATREAWGEAGDAFEKLENQAIVVKDTCKVAVYVGGVVATGGAAGIAASGTLAQVTVVVTGVDLALEVTEDGAQIALGDKNKVSSFVKDVRTVTEPIATVLSITDIPRNLGNAFGKFEAVNIGLEEFRASAQEGKVIGIDLKNFEYHPPFQVIKNTKYPGEVTVAELEKTEVEEWIKSVNKDYKPMTSEEVKEYITNMSDDRVSKEVAVQEGAKKEEEGVVEDDAPKGEISFSEWDDWGDADSRYKEDLIDKFGNPDVMQTSSGKQVWVYYDIVYYESGNTCSPTYTFYDTDQTATRRCLSKENVESVLNN
ncbi:MAG: hypothetical protein RBS01_01185 [Candidatus Dojkabacteria bacterium]|jgi:hypothetical protein|nr:hypothetical protein [Candidatus Dojkabacteria bacterium]